MTDITAAHELPLDFVPDMLRNAITSYQQTCNTVPTLELTGLWINGSYGAKQATPDSDIDITVEVGTYDTGPPANALQLADKITDLSGELSRTLQPELPGAIDLTCIPSKKIITAAELNAPTAHEHIVSTQQHGDYTTVYNVLKHEYEPVY